MEPRISLDTLELEPGERFKLIAPFLVITDRGRAFSAPWSSWRPLRVTPTGVVRAIYQGEVVEGSLGRMVAQAFLGAGAHDLVRRRDPTLGWAASNLHVYPPKAQRLPKPRRPTRKSLESWLKPGERPHHLDDDPELGVVITDQGRVFYLRAGQWVSAAIDAHGRFYVKTPERTFKRKLAKYVARYFMGAKDDEVPVQKPHATGWGVEDLELRSRLQGPQPIVTVTLGFSQEQHQQLVEQWGEQLEAKLKALILDQLPGHDLRSSCIRISARAGLTPKTLASLTGLSLKCIEDILDDPTLEGPARWMVGSSDGELAQCLA